MVRVVPTLAHRQDAEQHIISTHVVAVIRLKAPQMACGVDTPGHMMHQKEPDQATPDQPRPDPGPIQCDDAAQSRRKYETENHPEGEKIAHNLESAARTEVFHVTGKVRRVGVEEPAHVCVPETSQQANDTLSAMLGRMRIFWRIAVLMVLPVPANPLE